MPDTTTWDGIVTILAAALVAGAVLGLLTVALSQALGGRD